MFREQCMVSLGALHSAGWTKIDKHPSLLPHAGKENTIPIKLVPGNFVNLTFCQRKQNCFTWETISQVNNKLKIIELSEEYDPGLDISGYASLKKPFQSNGLQKPIDKMSSWQNDVAPKTSWTIFMFTSFSLGPISQSVSLRKAKKGCKGRTLQPIGPNGIFQTKWSFVNTTPVSVLADSKWLCLTCTIRYDG
jgi:hypothetical protein